MATKIAENLKKYRLEMNLSQEEVARAINKSRGTYSRYETGTLMPDAETFIELGKLFNVPLDYLAGTASTIDEIAKMTIPGYAIGVAMGDAINRKRISRRLKKQTAEAAEKQDTHR